MPPLPAIVASVVLPLACVSAAPPPVAIIDIWHGDSQRIGHLGAAQDDFNVLGHIEPWREIDTLTWSLNEQVPVPLSFRAFRRLVADGDFNVDIPIGRLRTGANTITLTTRLRDGRSLSRALTLTKESGDSRLPFTIEWRKVARPQDVGQIIDGHWELTPAGLRTRQVGYDRIFLIGERTWQDYEARTTFTVHARAGETAKDAGVGLLARFTGHVTGGPEHFPSGQPKWGFRPFGCIAWLRWRGPEMNADPQKQFFPGANARPMSLGPYSFQLGQTYAIRLACRTLLDAPSGDGVTSYQFKLWRIDEPEPAAWTWQQTQTSRDALRRGGVALLAHYVDVTFGDVSVSALP